jgi:hypothetical protein
LRLGSHRFPHTTIADSVGIPPLGVATGAAHGRRPLGDAALGAPVVALKVDLWMDEKTTKHTNFELISISLGI